jgi:hypothetical protein
VSMQYIRNHYGVPAKRGGHVEYCGSWQGVIVGSDGQYLRVRVPGFKSIVRYHPTWRMRYLTPDGWWDAEKRAHSAGGSDGHR